MKVWKKVVESMEKSGRDEGEEKSAYFLELI